MKTLQYTYFREYFDQQMNRKLKELQRFSVDADLNLKKSKITLNDIAKELGYKSPSSLSMIAKGDRLPSQKILTQLFNYWKTPVEERRNIIALVKIESKLQKGKKVLEELNDIKKNSRIEFSRIPMEKLEIVKDWYQLVIFSVIGLEQFKDHSTENFFKILDKKVTPAQINRALANLLKLNLITKNVSKDGEIIYSRPSDTISTGEDMPSEAIRSHHRGMIKRAVESIEEQAVVDRQISGLTFQVNKADVPEIKKEIQAFFSNVYEKYSKTAGDEVYQMNLQLFSHTPTKQKRNKKENQ